MSEKAPGSRTDEAAAHADEDEAREAEDRLCEGERRSHGDEDDAVADDGFSREAEDCSCGDERRSCRGERCSCADECAPPADLPM